MNINNSGAKAPTHLRVYKRVRDMILFGDLAPGAPVTIQGLSDDLQAGITPVREAIRRLTTEGALEFLGNRRVCVPVLTEEKLEELAFARLALEPKLAYWAALVLSPASIKALEEIDDALGDAVDYGNVHDYLFQNHRFHMTIYQAAKKPELLSIVERLWLGVGPSMRVICGRFGTHNLPDLHQILLEALRNGDPVAVEQAMRDDIEQGIETIRSAF